MTRKTEQDLIALQPAGIRLGRNNSMTDFDKSRNVSPITGFIMNMYELTGASKQANKTARATNITKSFGGTTINFTKTAI